MSKISKLIVLAVLGVFTFIQCKKDEPANPVIPNEQEVITTLKFKLTPNSSGKPIILSFKDLDGDGGNKPTISNATLATHTTYNGVFELLNEQKSPVDNVTEEIKEEAEEHQFFFQTDIEGLAIDYADKDEEDYPIGLKTTLKTKGEGSGNLTVILRHKPNKKAKNVSNGTITNAGGETDIEVTFKVEVK